MVVEMLINGGFVRLFAETTPTVSVMSLYTVPTITPAPAMAMVCAFVSMYNIKTQDTIYSILGNFCFYCIL